MDSEYYMLAKEEVTLAVQCYIAALPEMEEPTYTLQYAIQDGDELKMLDCCDVVSHEVLEGINNLIGLELINKYKFDELIYRVSEKEASL